MSSKKKMIVAISAFAMVILAAVVAVVAVLAAQQVTVQSSISVSYTSQEVAGTVTAKYQVAGGTLTDLGDGSATFYGTETGTPTKNLTESGAVAISGLTSTNDYVEFVFTFTNTGSADYTASLTLPASAVNFDISYTVPNTGGATRVSDTSFKVAKNTTTAVTYKVRYTIHEVKDDATLSGTFSWDLA